MEGVLISKFCNPEACPEFPKPYQARHLRLAEARPIAKVLEAVKAAQADVSEGSAAMPCTGFKAWVVAQEILLGRGI